MKKIFEDHEDDFDLTPYVDAIKSSVYKIMLLALIIGAALGAVRKFTYVPIYVSNTSWLGESQSANTQLGALATLAGVNLNQQTIPADRLYSNFLQTALFAKELSYKKFKTITSSKDEPLVKLIFGQNPKPNSSWISDSLEVQNRVQEWAKKNVVYSYENNIHQLLVKTTDPYLSQELCKYTLEELRNYNEFRRKSMATHHRDYLKAQLDSNLEILSKQEENYRNFQERNIAIQSPRLLLEQKRYLREIDVLSLIVLELRKQYELAKSEVNKEIQPIEPLVEPTLSEKPLSSKVAIWSVSGAMGSAFVYILILVLWVYRKQQILAKKEPKLENA